jgi:hypothetical protein
MKIPFSSRSDLFLFLTRNGGSAYALEQDAFSRRGQTGGGRGNVYDSSAKRICGD